MVVVVGGVIMVGIGGENDGMERRGRGEMFYILISILYLKKKKIKKCILGTIFTRTIRRRSHSIVCFR